MNTTTEDTMREDEERAAFETHPRYCYLSFDREKDAWGREKYKHSHIQALFEGFQEGRAYERTSQAALPVEDDSELIAALNDSISLIRSIPVEEREIVEGNADGTLYKIRPHLERAAQINNAVSCIERGKTYASAPLPTPPKEWEMPEYQRRAIYGTKVSNPPGYGQNNIAALPVESGKVERDRVEAVAGAPSKQTAALMKQAEKLIIKGNVLGISDEEMSKHCVELHNTVVDLLKILETRHPTVFSERHLPADAQELVRELRDALHVEAERLDAEVSAGHYHENAAGFTAEQESRHLANEKRLDELTVLLRKANTYLGEHQ